MSYVISLLDKSPVPAGATAHEALEATVRLAQRAEALGLKRFWVAEHHGNPGYAGSVPEVLVAHLLARTRRIRIGTGGVMLQHYSPFKVAEVFHLLEALGPGRVDLGIGKAPGGMPLTTRALQSRIAEARPVPFEDLLIELDAHLQGTLPVAHPWSGAVVAPAVPARPHRFLLGSSAQSARLAARLGWDFCYAGHFNEDPEQMETSFGLFREATGRSPSLALYGAIADTEGAARAQAAPLRVFRVQLPDGQGFNLPSLAAAQEFIRQRGEHDARIEERRPHVVAGTVAQVRQALDDLAGRWGIEEFVIDLPVADFGARLRAVELLAQALALEHAH